VRIDFGWRCAGELVLAAAAFGTISSCVSPGRLHSREVTVQVELDAFSGRPNPRWDMRGPQAAEFVKRLHTLRMLEANGSIADGLGYRGFIIRSNGERVNGYDEIRLYRGTVIARRGDRSERFSDPERGLERWLLDSARGHVDEPVLQHISRDIER
jgi:hypothetical protein